MLLRALLALGLACIVHFSALADAQTQIRPAMTFLGCYIDHGDRDLPVHAVAGSMSIVKCHEACLCRGFSYFGIQAGDHCFCGNSYGRHGEASISECNHHCSNEASVSCGGGWRNSIYTTGLTHSTPGMKLIGCYEDRGERDLPRMVGTEAMSLPKCYGSCKSKGFAYFGVQDHNYCFCGNSYGKYGERPESECNRRCSGQSVEFCGGGGRNSVYATGLAPK